MNLHSPEGLKTRPMNARVKEAMFNILGDAVIEANVLDMFAGSGSLGLEALSRGASFCYFVENGRHALPVLQANIEKARCTEQSKILKMDAFDLDQGEIGEKFHVFFMDPPYRYIDEPVARRQTLEFLVRLVTRYAHPDFIMVLHHRRHAMSGVPIPPPLKIQSHRAYGSTEIMFLCGLNLESSQV